MDLKSSDDAWRPRAGVINADMIREAVARMLRDDVPGNNIDEDEGYEFHEIKHLYLEHLDIVRIDHLWIMPALTVLKLTGNVIEKIENLDSLEQLVDLNLSFNRIRVIENLNKLIKLRHLSLYSNLISEIANVDHLKNLKIFTIGANKIEDRNCVVQLRRLDLFSLNLAGNPCAREEGFRQFIAAFLPRLEYYEYRKLADEERAAGRTEYSAELESLEREEAVAAAAAREADAQTAREAMHTRAFVQGLDGDQLYEAMMSSDPSGQAMLLIGEEVTDIFNTFKQEIDAATSEIFTLGLEQLAAREEEMELFRQGTDDVVAKSRAKQRDIIERFLESKSTMFLEMTGLWDVLAKQASEDTLRKSIEEKVDQANLLILAVKRELLGLELLLSEQLKEVFSQFERSLGDMVNSLIESAQGLFTRMRESEAVFSEQLGDSAGRFLAQLLVRNDELTSLPPQLRPVMVDKEAVNSAVAASHDSHLQVIDGREDLLMSSARGFYQTLCTDWEQKETTRFRTRISEIVNFLELQAKDFQLYNITMDEEAFILEETV